MSPRPIFTLIFSNSKLLLLLFLLSIGGTRKEDGKCQRPCCYRRGWVVKRGRGACLVSLPTWVSRPGYHGHVLNERPRQGRLTLPDVDMPRTLRGYGHLVWNFPLTCVSPVSSYVIGGAVTNGLVRASCSVEMLRAKLHRR
ncbi:hypothetical protein BHM03_00019791 [Ensete ventricosum]|nr:hypothetical protein BHM03_00019791 [Ensete ventricosum]